jgi:UDP-N-acetyl-D-mannosaminuronate dehydrogenase
VRDFDIPFTTDLDEAIEGADAIVLVTQHNEYLNRDLLRSLKAKMRTPVLIDGRNAYTKSECEKAGIIYIGVGKPR